MDESTKRKERLQAMRMEAEKDKDPESSQSAPGLLSNPFNDSSPPPTTANTPRFDYYTDPLAAFSKKKGSINNSNNNNNNNGFSQNPNGSPANKPRVMMVSPMNSSTPIKYYSQHQQSPMRQPNFHCGSPQAPRAPAPFGSPVSGYGSSGNQYYSSPFGFSTSSNESPLPMSPFPSFHSNSQSFLQQEQQQNQSGSQPRGFSNSSNQSPVPMSSAPRFNQVESKNNAKSPQPNSELLSLAQNQQQQNRSGSQARQISNSSNESPLPMTPISRFNQVPNNSWSQQPPSQPSASVQHQHQQNQSSPQPMHFSNSSNESPMPLTPVPRFHQVPNRDNFWSPQSHLPSSPLQQQQQQHNSGSQPRQYNGSAGRGSPWSDSWQSPGGRGSPWSEPRGRGSPSPGSAGRATSWSETRGSPGGKRGMPWMNPRGRGGRGLGGTPSPSQGRGGMQGRGSHHVSARERPDLFVKKSMVEDPWKNMVPVLIDSLRNTGFDNTGTSKSKGNCSGVDTGSVNLKKPKISQIKDDFQSGPSLAESLALSLSDVLGEEACS